MKLFFAAAAALLWSSANMMQVSAFSTGAGDCPAGVSAVGPTHRNGPGATEDTLDAASIEVRINGVALDPDTPFDVTVDETNTWELIVTGGNPDFRGFLLRLGGAGIDTDASFLLDAGNTNVQDAARCEDEPGSVGGVTHTNNNDKSSVSGSFSLDTVTTVALDVTVVRQLNPTSLWFYNGFTLNVVAAATPAPTAVGATPAPTRRITPSPTRAPTGGNGGGGAGGDPHIKTWSGKWYDFMGACDLHLVKAPYFEAEKDLVIDIRTKIRYGYSYIETAAIKIGDETMQVSSWGEYMINGVGGAELPATFAGYQVTYSEPSEKERKFDIHIKGDEKIVVTTFKDMVTVKLENTEKERFHGSLGMMGAFEDGAMLARDGKTIIEDPNKFAAEWQVRGDEPMLFDTVKSPQYPQKCAMPTQPMVQERIRRLGESLAQEAAEKACAHWPEDTREACIYDCIATGDLDLATAGAF